MGGGRAKPPLSLPFSAGGKHPKEETDPNQKYGLAASKRFASREKQQGATSLYLKEVRAPKRKGLKEKKPLREKVPKGKGPKAKGRKAKGLKAKGPKEKDRAPKKKGPSG